MKKLLSVIVVFTICISIAFAYDVRSGFGLREGVGFDKITLQYSTAGNKIKHSFRGFESSLTLEGFDYFGDSNCGISYGTNIVNRSFGRKHNAWLNGVKVTDDEKVDDSTTNLFEEIMGRVAFAYKFAKTDITFCNFDVGSIISYAYKTDDKISAFNLYGDIVLNTRITDYLMWSAGLSCEIPLYYQIRNSGTTTTYDISGFEIEPFLSIMMTY